MRQPPPLDRQDARGVDGLLDYLVRLEVAAKRKLAGRAERTADRTTGLRRDAQRRASGVAHHDSLDRMPAVELEQRLGREGTIRLAHRDRSQRGDPEISFERRTQRLGHIVHRLERGCPPREPTPELLDAV